MRWYLSAQHRDSSDDGCPSAALLDEIRRCTDPTKQAYTDGVLMVIDGIAARLAPDDPLSVRTKALGAYAMMAGTLQLSRALTDRQLADELLEQGIHNAFGLLGVEHGHSTPRCDTPAPPWIIPTQNSVDLARRVPNGELVLYPDAGHGGIFQFHGQLVETALEFLER